MKLLPEILGKIKYLSKSSFRRYVHPLTLTEKAEIKNLCRITPDLIISQSFSNTKETHVR